MIDHVDPFIGTEATDLPERDGIAASWWWPKPQIGNTHPGATHPFGMVSALAHSGAYPTGYGVYDISTEGRPQALFDRLGASGFTHFHQSGTGAIRKYYGYQRTTPMLGPLDDLGRRWSLRDETASPGYYAATLDSGIRAELTVGPRGAVHRYTFPACDDARVVIDPSFGGLEIMHGRTVPTSARLAVVDPTTAWSEVVMEGVPLASWMELDAPASWRTMLWYDRRMMVGGSRLEFESIRHTPIRPFGLVFRGPTRAGQSIELHLGFSLRGTEQARDNVQRARNDAPDFDQTRRRTRQAWRDELGSIRVDGGSGERRTMFATARYHAAIKPCFAADESPFWPQRGPFVFDISTMWDIYKTQLPLLALTAPARAAELATALLTICEMEGNLPIGYRMARGADRFARQGSALAHTFFSDLADLGVSGIDWDWALVQMHQDLRRGLGEDLLERGTSEPISHLLDLCAAYHSTARIARRLGDRRLADQFDTMASWWPRAFDTTTGLLTDSTFYEGSKANYSFRLLPDMDGRIRLAGGDRRMLELLDRFFGVDAPAVKQLGLDPTPEAVAAGYELGRFEGLNNEPDMEAPWSYHYLGRADRTTEIVHAAREQMFGVGRGGLPGNDDSGGLSAWYVWASLGLFPVAGQSTVLLTPPAFERTEIQTGGRPLEIATTGFVEPDRDDPPQHITGVELDGRRLDRLWVSMRELVRADRLVLHLGDDPMTARRPPSFTNSRTTDPTTSEELTA